MFQNNKVKGDDLLEIKISQDIRKYKTKDIGNFSFKEAGFLAGAATVGFGAYKLTNSIEIAIIPTAVILVIGFFKPYGMSAIQFFRTVVKENMTSQCYINETDFQYDKDEFEKLYGDDVVIPTTWDEVTPQTPPKINKQDAERIIK